jgi:hypothetical protein
MRYWKGFVLNVAIPRADRGKRVCIRQRRVSTGDSNSGSNVSVMISTGSDAFRWIQGRRLKKQYSR